MNSCVLMAEIIKEPELRYTSDNQTAVTDMLVQFPNVKPEEPPHTLKVVGWGNLAQEIKDRYHVGDRIIIEGRLGMHTIERSEGFKEKRAELTASHIYAVGTDSDFASPTASTSDEPDNLVPFESPRSTAKTARNADTETPDRYSAPRTRNEAPVTQAPATAKRTPSQDLDDIPF